MTSTAPIHEGKPAKNPPAAKPYGLPAALLKEAASRRRPSDVWSRLQRALAWMHLEDAAELQCEADRPNHPERAKVYGGIRSLAREYKGRIPYLLGLSLFAEGSRHDLPRLVARIEDGYYPGVDERWTDAFLLGRPEGCPVPGPARRVDGRSVRGRRLDVPVQTADIPMPAAMSGRFQVLAVMGSRLAEIVGREHPPGTLAERVRIVDVGTAGRGFRSVESALQGIRSGAYVAVLVLTRNMHETSVRSIKEAARRQGLPLQTLSGQVSWEKFWSTCGIVSEGTGIPS